MTEAQIRDFRSDDRDAVIALWRVSGLLHPLNDPDDDIVLCTKSGHGALFVGEEGDRVVGVVMVGHDGHRGWLYYLAVAPERRRRGLGGRLVAHAEAWLKGRGVPKVQLMIRGSNAAVAAFYERVGYAVEDRVIMSRRLDGKAPIG